MNQFIGQQPHLSFYVIFCIFATGASPTVGQMSVPVEVLAIRENSERLQSGEYLAVGYYSVDYLDEKEFDREAMKEMLRRHFQDRQSGVAPQQELRQLAIAKSERFDETLECVFDYESNRLSFSRTRLRTETSAGTASRAFKRAWFVGTPDQTLLVYGKVRDGALQVEIKGPQSPKDVGSYFQPIYDPRVLGFHGLDEIEVYGTYVFAKGLEETFKVADVGEGIRRIEAHVAGPSSESPAEILTWWCDAEQGFHPVRFEKSRRYLNPVSESQHRRNARSIPDEKSECTWQEVDGVWVLNSLSMNSKRGGRIQRLELSFDWKSVNKEVSPGHFDMQNWNLPDNSDIVDLRMGDDKPISVATIGEETEVVLKPPAPDYQSSRTTYAFLILNLFAISVFAGWWLRRKFGRTK